MKRVYDRHPQGGPDGMLSGHRAKRLGDLGLNYSDLCFCSRLLDQHRSILGLGQDDTARAIWMAILLRFTMCFDSTSKSRGAIDHKLVYETENERKEFLLMKDLRDKFVAHDENLFYQQAVGVGLDQEGMVYDLVIASIRADLSGVFVEVVTSLIQKAISYVEDSILRHADKVLRDVKSMTVKQRVELPNIRFAGNVLNPRSGRSRSSSPGNSPSPEPVPDALFRHASEVSFNMTVEKYIVRES